MYEKSLHCPYFPHLSMDHKNLLHWLEDIETLIQIKPLICK